MKKPTKHRKAKIVLITLAALFIAFLCIPVPRFDKPYSTVLTARNGELLGAKIADDGQWRFPATDTYAPKYIACLLEYEDHWFFFHPGFNPVSFVKSFINMELRKKLNLAHGNDRDAIASKIARNESMILDFQFRLLNE